MPSAPDLHFVGSVCLDLPLFLAFDQAGYSKVSVSEMENKNGFTETQTQQSARDYWVLYLLSAHIIKHSLLTFILLDYRLT